jgi:hypothetical protein
MNTEKIVEDIQSVQDNIREIKSTWGNTIMTLDNIKSGLKTDVQKKVDDAYQRGYDDATKMIASDEQSIADKAHQSGLDEAMNAFKKLYSCGWERDWKAMGFEFDEGEWSKNFEYIIGQYTAAEIVEKVKAYKDKEIHVGDEVTANSGAVYLVTYDKEPEVYGYRGIGRDGITYCYTIGTLTKTGKHYDSVDAYMRGE